MKFRTSFGKIKAYFLPRPSYNNSVVKDSANQINNKIIESANKLCSHLLKPMSSKSSDAKKEHLFSISPVTIDTIQQVIVSFPNSVTEGLDDISVVTLKNLHLLSLKLYNKLLIRH